MKQWNVKDLLIPSAKEELLFRFRSIELNPDISVWMEMQD